MLTTRRYVDSGPVPTVESQSTYEALWWLPDEPEDKVPGKVHIHPEHGVQLILNGVFRAHGSRLGSSSFSDEAIILGTQYSGAQFTLLECQEHKQEVPFGGGFQRQRFVVDQALIGHHFESPEDVRLEKFYIEVTHLKDWMRNVGLRQPESAEGGFFIEYDPERATTIPELRASLPSASVVVRSKPKILGGHSVEEPVGVEISEWIEIIPDSPISVETAITSHIEPLIDFLTLATGAPNSLLHLKARHPEYTEESPEQFIKIYPTTDYPRFDWHSLFNRRKMLYLADDVRGRFQKVIDDWFNIYEDLEDVCDLFFGVHYNQNMPVTYRFLSVMRALETYHRVRFRKYKLPQEEHGERVKEIVSFIPSEYDHRQWVNDVLYNSNYVTLRSRIIDLVEEGRPAIDDLVNLSEPFAKWAKDTRNFYTHRDERSSMNIARGEQLELLTQSLLWLLRILFMTEIGFTVSECRDLLDDNRRFRPLAEACSNAPWNEE